MAEVADHFERPLRQRFTEFIRNRNQRALSIIETLQTMRMRGWTAFLFGGIPRGIFDSGRNYRPRDLDLVFDDEHFSYFESAFEHFLERRNNYGGLRMRIRGLSVDAWPLSATWAFREGCVKEPSFERLPRTTFLNIDGLIVEAISQKGKKRRIYEAGFLKGWNSKTLDINLRENPHPGICVARTLHISRHYGFKISHQLSFYLWEVLSTLPLTKIQSAQVSHYGTVEFDVQELQQIRQRLEKHLSLSPLFPLALFPTSAVQNELPLRLDGTRSW